MAQGPFITDDGAIEVLPIHFDVPEHYIPLNTFIETARETEAIFEALNQRWFSGELKYRVVVVPPKEGTFLAFLGLAVLAVGGAAWTFLRSDPGDAFLRELTGHTFTDLMGIAGRKVREHVLRKPPIEETEEKAIEDHSAINLAAPPPENSEEQKVAAAIIVIKSTKTFLITDADKLRHAGLSPETFQEGFEARNEFYRACAEEKEIRAVGFDESEEFPIKRSDFARLQVSVEPRQSVDADDTPTVEITTLTVSSPNWARDDSKRQWRGKEAGGLWRNFKVSDEGFWALASNDQLNLHGKDTMKVQWSFRGTGKQRRSHEVHKVLEYNGEVLAEPLNDNALNSILGPHSLGDAGEDDLFGKR